MPQHSPAARAALSPSAPRHIHDTGPPPHIPRSPPPRVTPDRRPARPPAHPDLPPALQKALVERFGEAPAKQLLAAGGALGGGEASLVYFPVVGLLRAPLTGPGGGGVPAGLQAAFAAVFAQQWPAGKDAPMAPQVRVWGGVGWGGVGWGGAGGRGRCDMGRLLARCQGRLGVYTPK